MKTFQWPLRAFLIVGLIQFISCTKSVDTTNTDSLSVQTSNDLTFPTTSEFATCKLRNIIHEHGGVPELQVNGLFTYNSKGNPISLTYDDVGSGNQNHYFVYDKLGRLREYRQRYSENDPTEQILHKYGYDAGNRIVTDTTAGFSVSTLFYDSLGRIVKENIRYLIPLPTRNPTYTYDSRGNLAVAGWKSSSYDNKVSIFRTHPVFQFIHRNYSRNNAAPQTKYNSKGLPLTLRPSNDQFFNAYPSNPGVGYTGGISKVMYDCL